MSKYSVVTGKFPCHTCKVVVVSLRHYTETGELTWVCPEKHLSSVNLKATKKTKRDYE
jgi:hypothetical protein